MQSSLVSIGANFFIVMEFVEYIKSPKIDKVSLRRRGQAYLEGTLCVTGHHLIFSSRTDHKDELIVSSVIIFIVLCNFFLYLNVDNVITDSRYTPVRSAYSFE